MRLIDANKIIWNQSGFPKGDGFDSGLDWAFREDIEKLPTVDAVEVVHGRWKEWWPGISLIMTGEEVLYRCSECDAKYADVEGHKYCPNCGAKMDGGTKVNE